jgi:hypothetical protein
MMTGPLSCGYPACDVPSPLALAERLVMFLYTNQFLGGGAGGWTKLLIILFRLSLGTYIPMNISILFQYFFEITK